MSEMFKMLSIEMLLTSVVTGVAGYLVAYLSQKAKNRALKEDYVNLEAEKGKVVHDLNKKLEETKKSHAIEIEELKKEHSLDIDKRKYKYESKQRQYYDLMERLDVYNGCLLDVIQDDLRKIMTLYYHSTLYNDIENTVRYNELALDATKKIRSQQAELFSKLNSFKLSTNKDAIKLLERLCWEVTLAGRNLEECITYISSEEFRCSNGYVPPKFTNVNNINQNNISDIKSELIEFLKSDLEKM